MFVVPGAAQAPAFTYRKVMVPVRDGVRLETVIATPANATGPLPILFRRTPYGVPPNADFASGATLKDLAKRRLHLRRPEPARPIRIRGHVRALVEGRPREPEGDERDDRRLRHDRLAGQERAEQQRQGRHVRRVVRRPHLGDDAAASASGAEGDLRTGVARRPVDERRRPPLRGAARELRVRVRGATNRRTRTRTRISSSRPTTPTPGISTSARSRTSTRNISTAPFRTGTPSSSIRTTTRSGRTRRGSTQVKGAFVPNLNVAGFWDQEDPWGPWEIYPPLGAERSEPLQLHRRRPVVSRPVACAEGGVDRPHPVRRPRHRARNSARTSRRRGSATGCTARGTSCRGRRPRSRPARTAGGRTRRGRRRRRRPSSTCMPTARCVSIRRRAGDRFVQYVSDPANPVPYRQRPISPTYPAGDWRRWEVADQRFVDDRPDVATWVSKPLDRDLDGHRRARRRSVRVDVRNRQRLRRQADRRLSGERAAERLERAGGTAARPVRAVAQRLRAADRDGGPPRPLQHELRASAALTAEPAGGVRRFRCAATTTCS